MAGMSRTAPEDRGGNMSRDGRPDPATEAFLAHRNLLFTVAYEMLGSAADAEDVLQETWLRWVGVDLATVRDQRAYLVRITTRQALSRLRTLGRRKESYVGSWLPEPLLTAPDVAEDVELADSVSMAMLLVLETLTPTERAVFVLREVFALEYDEIAEAVGKSPAAVRQIAHRARAHVAARRPRGAVSPAETRHALGDHQTAVDARQAHGVHSPVAQVRDELGIHHSPENRRGRSNGIRHCRNPTTATIPRRNPWLSFKERTSSTTRRDRSRKSPVLRGISTLAIRLITR